VAASSQSSGFGSRISFASAFGLRLSDFFLTMTVIVLLILASLALAVAFLVCFIWAVRSGQFEDTYTPSMRVLTEDDSAKTKLTTNFIKSQT
jgi:cbb3-type cytochrome oxidase maturation protein